VWYQATIAVPEPPIATAGVSPVPGSGVSFAEAVAGRTAEIPRAIRSSERRIRASCQPAENAVGS